jgi:hypothetical protein
MFLEVTGDVAVKGNSLSAEFHSTFLPVTYIIASPVLKVGRYYNTQLLIFLQGPVGLLRSAEKSRPKSGNIQVGFCVS